jgi:hypothetical protein
MQRGCVSTLATSPKMAREGSGGSEIPAKADGGCNVLEGCAEPEIDPATAKQYSNAMTGPARMSPHAFGRRTTFQNCKSSTFLKKWARALRRQSIAASDRPCSSSRSERLYVPPTNGSARIALLHLRRWRWFTIENISWDCLCALDVRAGLRPVSLHPSSFALP